MTNDQQWAPCPKPEINDTLKWREPLWAAPNKPRGKPDKIGEQEIVAQLIEMKEFLQFKVISVKKLDSGDAPLKVKEGDVIRRKESTLKQGDCSKLES